MTMSAAPSPERSAESSRPAAPPSFSNSHLSEVTFLNAAHERLVGFGCAEVDLRGWGRLAALFTEAGFDAIDHVNVGPFVLPPIARVGVLLRRRHRNENARPPGRAFSEFVPYSTYRFRTWAATPAPPSPSNMAPNMTATSGMELPPPGPLLLPVTGAPALPSR